MDEKSYGTLRLLCYLDGKKNIAGLVSLQCSMKNIWWYVVYSATAKETHKDVNQQTNEQNAYWKQIDY